MLVILEPVFSGRGAPLYDGDDGYDEGAARRRVALTALRDLEYDRATGKLDEHDYGQLKTELSREALRHLEREEEEQRQQQAGGNPPPSNTSNGAGTASQPKPKKNKRPRKRRGGGNQDAPVGSGGGQTRVE